MQSNKTGYQRRMGRYGRGANEDIWKGMEGKKKGEEWCYSTSSKIFF